MRFVKKIYKFDHCLYEPATFVVGGGDSIVKVQDLLSLLLLWRPPPNGRAEASSTVASHWPSVMSVIVYICRILGQDSPGALSQPSHWFVDLVVWGTHLVPVFMGATETHLSEWNAQGLGGVLLKQAYRGVLVLFTGSAWEKWSLYII